MVPGGRELPRGVSAIRNLPSMRTMKSQRPLRLAIVGKTEQIGAKQMVSVVYVEAPLVIRLAEAHTLEPQNPNTRPYLQRRRYHPSPNQPRQARIRLLRKNRLQSGPRHANPGDLLHDAAESDATSTRRTGMSTVQGPSRQDEGNHTILEEILLEWDTVVSTARMSMAGTPDAPANLGTCTRSGRR